MYITGKKYLDDIILNLSIDTLQEVILFKEASDVNKRDSLSEEDRMKVYYRNLILEREVLQRPSLFAG